MNDFYPMVPLREVLTHYQEYIEAPESKVYPKLSVKLYGKGVVLDAPVDGATLRMKRHQIARSGQIILSEIWGKKGAIGIVPPEGEGALCTSHFFLFDMRKDQIEPGYLQAIFSANYLQPQLDQQAKGTTGYAAVRPTNLLSAEIPLPPLDEQRRIVARIEALAARIEEARGLRQRAVEEAEALWVSALNAAFSPYPYASNDLSEDASDLLLQQAEAYREAARTKYNNAHPWEPRIYHSDMPQLPQGWVWTDLGSVLTHIVDCVNDTPDFSPHPTKYIGLKSTNIRPYQLDLSEKWYMTEADFDRWNRREVPKPGDLLFTREAPLGNACILPESIIACLTQRIMLFRSDERYVSIRFILHFVNSSVFLNQIFENSRGLTHPHLRVKDAPTIRIPFCSLNHQHQIISYLDGLKSRVDDLKRLQAATAAELDALLPSLLDRAFKGEL